VLTHRLLQPRIEVLVIPIEQAVKQNVFAWEMIVERRFIDAGRLGDLARVRRFVATFSEQLIGRL